MYSCVYLLGSTGWQELEGISLISGYTSREEDGIFLSVVAEKRDQAFDFLYSEGMLRLPLDIPMYPSCQSSSEIACLDVLEAV